LPTKGIIEREAHRAGLSFELLGTFGESYAHTLRTWRERFLRACPQIRMLGFDEHFIKAWEYYLSYSAAGFDRGLVDVGLYRLRKPGFSSGTGA